MIICPVSLEFWLELTKCRASRSVNDCVNESSNKSRMIFCTLNYHWCIRAYREQSEILLVCPFKMDSWAIANRGEEYEYSHYTVQGGLRDYLTAHVTEVRTRIARGTEFGSWQGDSTRKQFTMDKGRDREDICPLNEKNTYPKSFHMKVVVSGLRIRPWIHPILRECKTSWGWYPMIECHPFLLKPRRKVRRRNTASGGEFLDEDALLNAALVEGKRDERGAMT